MSKNNVNRNTIFNTIKSVFGVIYPVITFRYISRTLMTDNVGKINFGNSIVSYFSLLASLGVTTYAIRECAKVKKNRDELEETASQILSINIFSTLIAYAALVILLIFAREMENYRLLICIQSATILFTTLGADWLNTAMEDFRFIAVRTMLMQLVSLVLMYIFVHRPDDYMIYAAISVLATSGANVINIFYRRKYCKTKITLNMNLRKHLPQIMLLFSLILSQTIYVNSDITILGIVKGDHEVGLYSTAVKIYQIINTTIASIAWVVMPQLSAGFAKKDYTEINRLLNYSLNFILVLGIPSLCGLEIIAPYLIVTLSDETYIGATIALRILGLAMLFSFLGGWVGNMTRLPAGKEKISLKISIVCALINIILNFLLIPLWGLNAAALTTALSELVGFVWGIILIDRRIHISDLKEMLKGPIIGGLGIMAIGFIVQRLLDKAWMITIITVFVSLCWYIGIMFITKNEFFLGFVRPLIDKIRKRDE